MYEFASAWACTVLSCFALLLRGVTYIPHPHPHLQIPSTLADIGNDAIFGSLFVASRKLPGHTIPLIACAKCWDSKVLTKNESTDKSRRTS